MNNAKYWQESNDSCWMTDTIHTCDVCGEKNDTVIQVVYGEDEKTATLCWTNKGDCFRDTINFLFSQNPNMDFVYARLVTYKNLLYKNKKTKKRESIGLSLRYDVMKRDGFQCVLCGNSGKNARLEIDHIIPVSKGGLNTRKNLRTLCFACNRGKGAK